MLKDILVIIGQPENSITIYLKFISNFSPDYPPNIDFKIEHTGDFFDLHILLDDILNNHEKYGMKLFCNLLNKFAAKYENIQQYLLGSYFTEKYTGHVYCSYTFQNHADCVSFIEQIHSALNITDKNKSSLEIILINSEEYYDMKNNSIDYSEFNYYIDHNSMNDDIEKLNAFCHAGEEHEEYCHRNIISRKFLYDENYPKIKNIEELNKLSDYVCDLNFIGKYEKCR